MKNKIFITEKGALLPFKSNESGEWEFMTAFDRDYQYVKFDSRKGENIIVPVALREREYSYKLFSPNGDLFATVIGSKAISLENKEI